MKRVLFPSFLKISLLTLVLFFVMIGLGYGLKDTFSPIENALATVAKPFHSMGNTIKENISQLYGQAFLYDALVTENKALKLEISQLKAEEWTRETLSAENEKLRSLLSFQQTRQEVSLTEGTVISYSSDNFRHVVTLGQGENVGISLGNAMIDEAGNLLGVVSDIGATWATVTLITDPNFTMGALGQNGEGGILEGSLSLMADGLLSLTLLPPDSSLKVGDFVETFTSETLYPTGLYVGSVVSLTQDPSGYTSTAIIRPQGDLQHLGAVFLITDFSSITLDEEELS